jgi:hypothetical protein
MDFESSKHLAEKNSDLFEEYGLKVASGEVEIGRTYPIFGMITRLIDETPGQVVAEINYNIVAKMQIAEVDKINILKERAFESGIFLAKITSNAPIVEADCQTVIFGKRQAYNA